MQLLEQDELFLKDHGYEWEVLQDKDDDLVIIIRKYPLAPGKFDQDLVDLLIRIPKAYNDAKLDMFYVDPPVRLKTTGQYPEAASHFEDHASRKWQRFSRHLPRWRPGLDTLQNYMPLISHELQNRG